MKVKFEIVSTEDGTIWAVHRRDLSNDQVTLVIQAPLEELEELTTTLDLRIKSRKALNPDERSLAASMMVKGG